MKKIFETMISIGAPIAPINSESSLSSKINKKYKEKQRKKKEILDE